MTTAQIQLPKKLIPVFVAENVRYRGAYGGRGSAKTRTFALMTAIKAYQFAEAGISGAILCAREFMNSLADSSMEEIKQAIQSVDWLNDYFDIGQHYIRTRNGLVSYIFCGLRHNLDSIKSKARILLCWVDEAEKVSEMAWRKLTPTVREANSEIWITWNPETKGSPTDLRFRQNPPENSSIVELNYNDNPFFPKVLEQERLNDLERLDYASYAWIWEGAYLENSDKQVLNGKYVIQEFDDDLYKKADRLLFGGDFGYANDPSTLIRSFILNDCLYIEYEAYGVHVELDEMPSFYDSVPESRKWLIKGDSSRPETISYIKRKGFNISAAKKWQGSVEDGISFLRGFKKIIIHPRCKHTAEEAKLYCYKTDRVTGEVLPIIEDKNNHCWDGIRYSLDGYIKSKLSIWNVL
ncbi:MAG: hypothetical protein [Caudoviricetes sp.]|nr:MAG: hypothetical protein [Caudoviricetes sp.]